MPYSDWLPAGRLKASSSLLEAKQLQSIQKKLSESSAVESALDAPLSALLTGEQLPKSSNESKPSSTPQGVNESWFEEVTTEFTVKVNRKGSTTTVPGKVIDSTKIAERKRRAVHHRDWEHDDWTELIDPEF
jgi:hypothetical protein